MEDDTEARPRPTGSLPGRKLARQLIVAVELAIAIPLTLSVILGFLAEKKALIGGIGESMNQEVVLLSQLVQREPDPIERQRLLDMYCRKMVRHGRAGHYLMVMSDSGEILASNVEADGADGVGAALRARLAAPADAGRQPVRTRVDGIDALEVITKVGPAAGQEEGLALYYSEPLAQTNRAVWRTLGIRLLFLASALLVTFAGLWLMVKRKVSDPLWQLYLGQLDVWLGARSHLRAPRVDNEIGELYKMHNAMVDRIKEHEKALVGATNAAEAGRMARKLTRDIKQDTEKLLDRLHHLVVGKPLEDGQVKVALCGVADIADGEQDVLRKLTDFELITAGSHDVLVEEEFHLLENDGQKTTGM